MQMRLIRADTGEVVESRAFTDTERQTNLLLFPTKKRDDGNPA